MTMEEFIQKLVGNTVPHIAQTDPTQFMQDIPGLIERGNINLYNRPNVPNPEGGTSSVYSMHFGTDKGQVLVPRVRDDGRIMDIEEAIRHYFLTGNHLGIFGTAGDAEAYANMLHQQQERLGNAP